MGTFNPGGYSGTPHIKRELRRGVGVNKDEDRKDRIKILFLGARGSGKSTLFRQFRLLHANGLNQDERMSYKHRIYLNIVEGLKTLLEGNLSLNGDVGSDNKELESPPDIVRCDEKLADYIDTLDEAAPISEKCVEYLKKAWNDKGMQQTWEERSQFQLQDSLKYFMDNIERIAKEGYIPSKDDVMHVRITTTGILEEHLTIEDTLFLIVDVGGQRTERRKWIRCFDDVNGLIFVASLTAYNQVLYEDERVNRLKESLGLFKSIFANDTFNDVCIVLFLNKCDLFSEMIKTRPLTKCFSDYKGNETEVEQYDYIKNLYEKLALREIDDKKQVRPIFIHKTCATNTAQMREIFNAVNRKIILRALVNAGLIAPG